LSLLRSIFRWGHPVEHKAAFFRDGLITSLLQGLLLLWLHERLASEHWAHLEVAKKLPIFVLAFGFPTTFIFLRSKLNNISSIGWASLISGGFFLSSYWFSGSALTPSTLSYPGSSLIDLYLSFGLIASITWLILLTFVQVFIHMEGHSFRYERVFSNVIRVFVLLTYGGFLLFGVWLLLLLLVGLFETLGIGFFSRQILTPQFIYPVSSLVFGASIIMGERRYPAESRYLVLSHIGRLLPLASLILVLFLSVLPWVGLQPLWDTHDATTLMLVLQLAIIVLVNASWRDGRDAPMFPKSIQWLIRLSLVLLPIMGALCIWALGLRVQQHGWTVDRIWAGLIILIVALIGFLYAQAATDLKSWLKGIGPSNHWIALVLLVALLLMQSPILDPRDIAAKSQEGLLLSGKVSSQSFNYDYLHFKLGRPGLEALQRLTEVNEGASSDEIRRAANESMAKKAYPWGDDSGPPLSPQKIFARFRAYPKGAPIDPSFAEYLNRRYLDRIGHPDWRLPPRDEETPIDLLVMDLGSGPEPEVLILHSPFLVFTKEAGVWREVGKVELSSGWPREKEILDAIDQKKIKVLPHTWQDIMIAGRRGTLVERTPSSKEDTDDD